MIRHYVIFAFRNLWRNKFHSFINILGLAIGVSACLVIYLIVSYELSFNTKIPDGDRIHRVHSKFTGSYSGLNRGAPTAIAPTSILRSSSAFQRLRLRGLKETIGWRIGKVQTVQHKCL